MRVVSFNIQHGRRRDGVVDVDLVARRCAQLEPDLLALQEVDVGVRRSGRVDTVAVVAAASGLCSVFGPASRVQGGRYGNALFSRIELDDVQVVALPRRRRNEQRGLISGRFGTSMVACTHLSVDPVERQAQLLVVNAMDVDILVGDFNEDRPDLTGSGRELVAGPPTFPAARARARIDHVAVVPGWTVERSDVVDLDVSDHLAVVVDLRPSG